MKIEQVKHPKGIIENFFLCPHCSSKYPVTITTPEIRRRIKHFVSEWGKMSKLKNGKEWKKDIWMKKYHRLQRFKAETDEMINRVKERFN